MKFFKMIKNIRCRSGMHNWQTFKSIRISNLIIIIKIHNPILKKVNIDYGNNYIVKNRQCIDCDTEDFELDHMHTLLKDLMFGKMKIKK